MQMCVQEIGVPPDDVPKKPCGKPTSKIRYFFICLAATFMQKPGLSQEQKNLYSFSSSALCFTFAVDEGKHCCQPTSCS